MKNIRQDLDDLRPEYKRSDFGEMVTGKHALAQLEVGEFVRLWIVCIGEDEGLRFTPHSQGNYLTGHKTGDWTYEFDNARQITLRYWISEFSNIAEPLQNPLCVTTPEERDRLENLLIKHVRNLKTRVLSTADPNRPIKT